MDPGRRDPRRRRTLAALGALALAGVLPPAARAAPRIRRVGMFDSHPRGSPEGQADEFATAMNRLGYVEGRDVEYLHRVLPPGIADPPRLDAIAAELVRARPEAMIANGTDATSALARATASIPIVTNMGDPVGAGLARSLARPGGNVTGVALANPETFTKTFDFLKSIIPGRWSYAMVLPDQATRLGPVERGVEDAARSSSIPVTRMVVHGKSAGEVEAGFAAMRGQGIRAVGIHAPLPGIGRRDHVGFALRHGLVITPTIEAEVAGGALLSYQPTYDDVVERKASQLARILRGTPPGEIPFEMPSKFRLTVNTKTARALGYRIPPSLLVLADKVYE